MNLRTTITRKRAFLPALVLSVAVAVASAATVGASGQKPDKLKAERDTPVVMKEIKEGKAKKLPTPPGAEKTLHGVWTGCKFVYLTTDTGEYQFDDGSIAVVSDNPQAAPPKDCNGPDRNPTEGEMNAMQKVVDAHNARGRPDGSPPPPPTPRARHLSP